MRPERLSRRRILTIVAATATAFAATKGRSRAAVADYEWRGLAMGADARIVFCGGDGVEDAVQMAVAEIERLEDRLSLFRRESEICRLNRAGVLTSPSGDLRRALALGLAVARTSGGLYDPTVQALWEAHVDWFAAAPDAGIPPDEAIAAARDRVDWRRVEIDANRIRLGPGQRITLNGLGQGYVTDRVAGLLRMRGFAHVLVDLGEQRALGPREDGTPWLVAHPGGEPIPLRDGALATSEGGGCVIGAGGTVHHLFDPRSGRSAGHWRRITVGHDSAAMADALSTALYAATPAEIADVLKRFPGAALWATDQAGREWRLGAG